MKRGIASCWSAALVVAFAASLARAASYPPAVGQHHPLLVLWSIDHDRPIGLSSFLGRKVLLIHFASWSPKSREALPLWYEVTKPFVSEGKLVVLAVAQEQHAERAKLFAKWKNIDWPMLHDPLNLAGPTAVPLVVAIDEGGVVRSTNLTPETLAASFVNKKFRAAGQPPATEAADELPEPRTTRRRAREGRIAEDWCYHGDALVLAGAPPQVEEAIDSYKKAVALNPKSDEAWFRLGVACRVRFDSEQRQPGDFQAAVDAWQEAVKLRSRCEVYRDRVQPFGPPTDRSCAFYDWISSARKATRMELAVPPLSVETAAPTEKFVASAAPADAPPTEGVEGDAEHWIAVEPVVVRGGKAGDAEVLLLFQPDAQRQVKWDNDSSAPGLRTWIKPDKGALVSRSLLKHAKGHAPVSAEPRTLCVTVHPSKGTKLAGALHATAVYGVKQGAEGKARVLKQDIEIKLAAEQKREERTER